MNANEITVIQNKNEIADTTNYNDVAVKYLESIIQHDTNEIKKIVDKETK